MKASAGTARALTQALPARPGHVRRRHAGSAGCVFRHPARLRGDAQQVGTLATGRMGPWTWAPVQQHGPCDPRPCARRIDDEKKIFGFRGIVCWLGSRSQNGGAWKVDPPRRPRGELACQRHRIETIEPQRLFVIGVVSNALAPPLSSHRPPRRPHRPMQHRRQRRCCLIIIVIARSPLAFRRHHLAKLARDRVETFTKPPGPHALPRAALEVERGGGILARSNALQGPSQPFATLSIDYFRA
jgi:hypothetical protein